MAKLNQFHIGKTIDNHSRLNKKLLAYYSQSNEEMTVGKSEMANKVWKGITPIGRVLNRRQE